jgi:AcrR family transcriptional regulator
MPQRPGYHHGDLANALIAAATQLARDGGPEAVVLREVARIVGVSATAAYRHFTRHSDLMHAVKQGAQDDLVSAMRAELAMTAAVPDPSAEALRQLRALGHGYLRFALAEPGLFRTAFAQTNKSGEHEAPGQSTATMAGSAGYQLLAETLDELVAVGMLDPGRRRYAEIVTCSWARGLAMLLLDGPLSAFPAELRDQVIFHGLDHIRHYLTGDTRPAPAPSPVARSAQLTRWPRSSATIR